MSRDWSYLFLERLRIFLSESRFSIYGSGTVHLDIGAHAALSAKHDLHEKSTLGCAIVELRIMSNRIEDDMENPLNPL